MTNNINDPTVAPLITEFLNGGRSFVETKLQDILNKQSREEELNNVELEDEFQFKNSLNGRLSTELMSVLVVLFMELVIISTSIKKYGIKWMKEIPIVIILNFV